MTYLLLLGSVFGCVALTSVLGWQLLRQNGRMLLRIEALEIRLEEFETAETEEPPNGDAREDRFSRRDLARSKIKRDGLKAGNTAPEFRLPLLEGGELSLSELRGRPVLLVFSSPTCGPCNILAPKLQKFHRKHPDYELVMISRGEPEENRKKVQECGLTFRVALQQQWEVSRLYAMFATPVAYLIDPAGVIVADVALGVDAILDLMGGAKHLLRQRQATPELATV